MTKRTTEIAIFSVAGGLLLWGAAKARTEPGVNKSKSTSALVFGGMGLALFGAYRMSPRLGLGLTGAIAASGAVNHYRMNRGLSALPFPAISFGVRDKLDDDTQAAVQAALDKESDPAMLHAFAARLNAAGHRQSADAIAKKASALPTTAVGQAPAVVQSAQTMLHDLGYDIDRDGALGPKTVEAIKKFQSLYDLEIDGILGTATLAALRSASTKH